MTNKEKLDNKKILIYLYEQFNGDNGKIITELFENNLKASMVIVNQYIKDNNIRISDYRCVWEKKFPKRYIDDLNPSMIIHIKDIKSAKKVFNQTLISDDKRFSNMSVKDLIDEMGLDKNISLSQLNEILIENNIKPFN